MARKEQAPASVPTDGQALLALVNRMDTDSPSPEDVNAVQRVLQDNPHLWRLALPLADVAAGRLIRIVAAKGGAQALADLGFFAMKAELGYRAAPPLERLLIDQVALTWLRLHLLEQRLTQVTAGRHSHADATYWDQRVAAAQRRHLRACETLARIRKLRLPAFQLNIAAAGGQQVNVSG